MPELQHLAQIRPADAARIARRAPEPDDVLEDLGVDVDRRVDELAQHVDVRRRDAPLDRRLVHPHLQHLDFFARARIADAQHHREAVQLRLGQRVDAFLLDRVLRRQHPERIVEREGGVGERDLPLLHRLEQRALRLRRRAVDLVGEQDVREDRPLLDAEGRRLRVVDARAEDVGRQQVGRELHALELRRDRLRQGRRRQRLGDAGDALEQQVAAAGPGAPFRHRERDGGEERRQHPPDQRVLPDDHLADLVLETGDDLPGRLGVQRLLSASCARSPS